MYIKLPGSDLNKDEHDFCQASEEESGAAHELACVA